MHNYPNDDDLGTHSMVNPWQHIWVSILTGIGLGIGAALVGYALYAAGLRPKGR